MKKSRDKANIDPFLMLFDYIHESQNPDICQLLTSEIGTTNYLLSTRDVIAIKYIIFNKKLKYFSMRNEDLSVRHLKLLTPALAKNTPAQLGIRDTNIGDEGVAVIADSIKGTTSLRILAFINNIIGMIKVGAEVLGQALYHSKVQSLVVCENKLGSTGLTRLTSHLANTNFSIPIRCRLKMLTQHGLNRFPIRPTTFARSAAHAQ